MPSDPVTPTTAEPISIPEMAQRLDKPAWMVARGVARLLSAGLMQVADGTPGQAIASLREQYVETVNGR